MQPVYCTLQRKENPHMIEFCLVEVNSRFRGGIYTSIYS
jgi:hypothetical protein